MQTASKKYNNLIIKVQGYTLSALSLQDDFNNQLWNVVMLAMGGSALGEAVKSSGLLTAIAHSIEDVVRCLL